MLAGRYVPRTVTAVLAEEGADSVTVTWGLGEPVNVRPPAYFGYGLYYYDPAGYGGKRFGVRFGDAVTAWVFDNASSTQANYGADDVTVTEGALIVRFRDASLGLPDIGTIAAYAQVEGRDEQLEIPVTLLRQ